jgi:hypothetical protein
MGSVEGRKEGEGCVSLRGRLATFVREAPRRGWREENGNPKRRWRVGTAGLDVLS